MHAPAVYKDRHNRTTLVVVVGRKFIGHLPMEAPITVKKTRIGTFERDFQPVMKDGRPYPVERAVQHYLSGNLPITERALRMLKRVAVSPITEDEFLTSESETDMTTENVETTATETTTAPKAKRAKAKAEKTPAKAAKQGKGTKAEAKASKSSSKAGKAPKKEATGRPPLFQDGQKIKLLVKENPKREGTGAYERFAIYKNGMTVAQYLAAGGKRSSLKYDTEHGFIEIK